MKRTLLTLTLVAAAGTAGAQTASVPGTTGAGVTPPLGTGASINNSVVTNGNTGMQGAQMGVGTQTQMNGNVQSPATGQMNSSSTAGASASTNVANAPMPAQRLTGAAGTAQRRIEQDGYKSVQNLQKGSDGLWHGTAMRGGTQVQVTVDRAGRVSGQ